VGPAAGSYAVVPSLREAGRTLASPGTCRDLSCEYSVRRKRSRDHEGKRAGHPGWSYRLDRADAPAEIPRSWLARLNLITHGIMISIVSLMLARIWSSSKIGPTPLHKSVIPMIPRSANGANSGVLGCQEGHGCQLVSAGFKNRVSSIGIAPLLCPTKRSMLFLLSYFRVITTVLLAIIPGVRPSTALKISYTRMNSFTVSIRDAVPHSNAHWPHSNVPLSKGT
jgi:hypothetical protein